jgi:LPS sulfotransferase NodH
VATPRSGSNLLVDYINQLPHVQSLSEILNFGLEIGPKKCLHYRQAINHIRYSMQTLQTPYRACKLFLRDLANYRLTLDDLESAFPEPNYLVIYRQNLAEQFVSHKQAKATQQWILLPGEKRKKAAITIDPAELRKYSNDLRRGYDEIIAHPAVRERGTILSYEELTEDPARCLREKICPLLGVPAIEPKTALRKQNVQPLADRVANFDEVAALVASPLCRQQPGLSWQRSQQARAA